MSNLISSDRPFNQHHLQEGAPAWRAVNERSFSVSEELSQARSPLSAYRFAQKNIDHLVQVRLEAEALASGRWDSTYGGDPYVSVNALGLFYYKTRRFSAAIRLLRAAVSQDTRYKYCAAASQTHLHVMRLAHLIGDSGVADCRRCTEFLESASQVLDTWRGTWKGVPENWSLGDVQKYTFIRNLAPLSRAYSTAGASPLMSSIAVTSSYAGTDLAAFAEYLQNCAQRRASSRDITKLLDQFGSSAPKLLSDEIRGVIIKTVLESMVRK